MKWTGVKCTSTAAHDATEAWSPAPRSLLLTGGRLGGSVGGEGDEKVLDRVPYPLGEGVELLAEGGVVVAWGWIGVPSG